MVTTTGCFKVCNLLGVEAPKSIMFSYVFIYIIIYIWRCPEMGVPKMDDL